MQPFEFATAQQIIFGRGTIAQLPACAARHAIRRAFVLTGSSASRLQPQLGLLTQAGIEVQTFAVTGEPSIPMLRQAIAKAVDFGCDGVIAIGGGSVIDTGKALAAVIRNPADLFEYLEVIGRGRPLEIPSAPMIAVPTTAGTGAEVTRNAVLFSPEHKVKVSLRSPTMLPVTAIVDPDLTRNAPAQVTAWSGMDALTQLIEPYVSRRANPLTDALCVEAIPKAAHALPRAFRNGHDMEARTAMSLASLFGGLALANSGLGVVHGFASPLGGMFNAAHGAICASILPQGMAANIARLRLTSGPEAAATLQRYRTVARCLTGNEEAQPEAGVAFVRQLCQELQIPRLGSFGMSEAAAGEVVEKAARASSMKANPVTLSNEELREVYLNSL